MCKAPKVMERSHMRFDGMVTPSLDDLVKKDGVLGAFPCQDRPKASSYLLCHMKASRESTSNLSTIDSIKPTDGILVGFKNGGIVFKWAHD